MIQIYRTVTKSLVYSVFTLNATYVGINTGCNSDIWKKVQVNIHCNNISSTETNHYQQKAHDLSFNLIP